VNVGTAGAPVINGGALGTPSSGTLTNATGLPVAGIVDSTTEALGVGSLELGHASDTTLTRVSAGVVAVEGATVATLSTSQTFTLPQYGTKATDNDLSFDIGAAGKLFFDCTPTAGGVLTFTNIPASPCWITIKLVNGSNYAITAHANTKVTSSFLSAISATGTYVIAGYCDGTNVHCATAGASA
jgi:hypothetical protein